MIIPYYNCVSFIRKLFDNFSYFMLFLLRKFSSFRIVSDCNRPNRIFMYHLSVACTSVVTHLQWTFEFHSLYMLRYQLCINIFIQWLNHDRIIVTYYGLFVLKGVPRPHVIGLIELNPIWNEKKDWHDITCDWYRYESTNFYVIAVGFFWFG